MNIYSDTKSFKICVALVIIGVLASLFLMACGSKNQEFETNYVQLLKEVDKSGFLAKLIDLELKYPGQVKIKTKIGFMLLTTGKVEKARPYIIEAKALESKADQETKGRLYLDLALLAYQDKDYKQGLADADRALKFVPDLEEAAAVKASCLFQTGDKEGAYKLYEGHWAKGQTKMTRDDLLNYSEILLEKQNYKRELEVLEQYQKSCEYNDGLGFLAARIYGFSGDIEKAILASAMDLEYNYASGLETQQKIVERLVSLEAAIKKDQLDPDGKGTRLLSSIKHFFLGNYQQALDALKENTVQFPFFDYLFLVCRLETSAALDPEIWENYKDGEDYFKNFPTYYYHYWQGLKKAKNLDFNEVNTIMTKCILSGPASPFAQKTRVELGKVSGMKEADSQYLLTSEELDSIFEKTVQEQNLEYLTPVLNLLNTADNTYEALALVGLQKLATKMPQIHAYLDSKEATATGLLKERLRLALNKKS